MATTIATRKWSASGWSTSQYIQFKWVASTSSRTASSVKVTVTMTAKAYGVVKADLVSVGGNVTMSCTVGGTSFAASSVAVVNLLNTQTSTVTKTISVSSGSTSLATTSRVAGDNVSLAVASGTSVPVSAYVPPKSVPSWDSDPIMDEELVVNLNRASSAYTHEMTLTWEGELLWIGTNVGASTNITVSSVYAASIPNSQYLTASLETKTYNGTTLIGTTVQSMKIYVPSYNLAHNVTITPYNAGMPIPTYPNYLKNYTKLYIDATYNTSGWYGATLSVFTANGLDISSGTAISTQPITSDQVTVVITDSRGNTATETITLSPYDTYTQPSLSLYELTRITVSGKTVLQPNIVGSYKNLNGLNVPSLVVKYASDANVTPALTYSNGNITNCANIVRPSGSYPDTTFNITLTLSDTMGSSVDYNLTINTLEVPLDIQQYGVGIGKLAAQGASANPLLEVAWSILHKGNKLGFETNGNWRYWKADGLTIAFGTLTITLGTHTAVDTYYHRHAWSSTIPSGIFNAAPQIMVGLRQQANTIVAINGQASSATAIAGMCHATRSTVGTEVDIMVIAIGV